jgi:hypothetical protein
MKRYAFLLIALFAVLTVSPLAGAERMILQAPPKANAAAAELCDVFYVCSMWHELSPNYCTNWHVIYCGPVLPEAPTSNLLAEKAFKGSKLVLENRTEVREVKIQRLVPQYHLASGAVVEPRGEWNANNPGGEEWAEVRPNAKRSYQIANWDDANADGMVGEGDRVVFKNGTRSEIKAVRMGVHVEIVKTEPRR